MKMAMGYQIIPSKILVAKKQMKLVATLEGMNYQQPLLQFL
jgi:hypothetical protein